MIINTVEDKAQLLLEKIRSRGLVRNYQPGEVIYGVGEASKGFYFIESGLVGHHTVDENGKKTLLRVYSKGSFFGYRSLLEQGRYYATTIAMKPCRVLYFHARSMADLQTLAPEAMETFALLLAGELREVEQRFSRASSMKMKNRVVHSMLYLEEKDEDYLWSCREIGEFCGGVTESVIRICHQLNDEGVIAKVKRRWKIAPAFREKQQQAKLLGNRSAAEYL